MNFLVMPIFFLSGALFPLQGVPTVLAIVAKCDPLTYGIDALRWTLISASTFGIAVDLLVIIGITVLLLIIGSYLFEKIEV
jgi:ABC-2 type transport system permease protein